MKYRFAAFGSLCLLGLTACSSGNDGASSSGYRGTLMPEPIPKADFTLIDTDGQPFHFREETEGYVTLLFFGYTHCPDICPVHMANIAAVLDDFPFDVRKQIKVVFVSTDPARDTRDRLRSWLDNFDRSFIGLRGDLDEVNEIQAKFFLPPAMIQEGEGDDYLVGHSAAVLAFTRDNLAHLRYPFGTRQADWSHDLPKLVNETW